MNKSMWFNIRKNAGLKQQDIANNFNVSKQYIHKIENGKMPINYQIYYLSLRNTEYDKTIIKHLKELQSKYKEHY